MRLSVEARRYLRRAALVTPERPNTHAGGALSLCNAAPWPNGDILEVTEHRILLSTVLWSEGEFQQ
jgi:hypothetical protein